MTHQTLIIVQSEQLDFNYYDVILNDKVDDFRKWLTLYLWSGTAVALCGSNSCFRASMSASNLLSEYMYCTYDGQGVSSDRSVTWIALENMCFVTVEFCRLMPLMQSATFY